MIRRLISVIYAENIAAMLIITVDADDMRAHAAAQRIKPIRDTNEVMRAIKRRSKIKNNG